MAKTITRKFLKLFGQTGATDRFARVGSDAAAAPIKTKDIDDIQSLPAWLDGLESIILSGNRVLLKEDLNSILYALCYSTRYQMQEGIPEWSASETYFIGSLCRNPGTGDIYQSKIDDNTGNALPSQDDNSQWSWFNRPAISPGLGVENFSTQLPTGRWLWQDGAAYTRTTYAALFAAITRTCQGNVASGSNVVSGLTVDPRTLNIIGSIVEGLGIPVGTTVVSVTATSMTLSKNATGTAAGTTIRFLPYGQGDGFSTFNVPDKRARIAMGAGTDGTLTQRSLGQKLGEENHLLSVGEMPAHAHGVNDPGHFHDYFSGVGSPGDNGIPSRDNDGNTPDRSPTTSVNTTGVTIAATGGGQAHNNVPPVLVCNFIISY